MNTPDPVFALTSTDAINNLALLGLAMLQAYGIWRQRVNKRGTHEKIDNVIHRQDRIYELVNKPFGVALDSLATALDEIARGTPTEVNILKAVAAREASNVHAAMQLKADQEAARMKLEKAEIIANFLKEQK